MVLEFQTIYLFNKVPTKAFSSNKEGAGAENVCIQGAQIHFSLEQDAAFHGAKL